MSEATYYLRVSPTETGTDLTFALEVNASGHVMRELGYDASGVIRHKAPIDPRRQAGRVWDMAWFGDVGLRSDMTRDEFEELWSRSGQPDPPWAELRLTTAARRLRRRLSRWIRQSRPEQGR